jgi:hypothetical protein
LADTEGCDTVDAASVFKDKKVNWVGAGVSPHLTLSQSEREIEIEPVIVATHSYLSTG